MLLGALQENIITLACYDPTNAPIIRGAVALELFGGPYRLLAARCYDYLDRFKKPPGDHLPDLLSDKLEGENRREGQLYADIIENIHTAKDQINSEYVMSQLETYIKRQSLRSVAVELTKALQRDTEESLEEAEQLFSKANHTSLSLFDPGTRLDDKKRALRFLDIAESALPTGIPELDKRNLGPVRKELWLLIANAKKGKCVAEGELVLCGDGSYIPIEQFPEGGTVLSLNEKSKRFEVKPAVLKANGLKPTIIVTTRTGRTIRLTTNHKVLTPDGWKPVDQLERGSLIAAPYELPFFGIGKMPSSHSKILGYMIADGGMTQTYTPTFTKQDKEVLKDFEWCVTQLGGKLSPAKGRPTHFNIVRGKEERNNVGAWLRINGLMEKKSNVKQVPQSIMCLNKSGVASFLNALFTCDGSIYKARIQPVFEYSTTSRILMQQVDHLVTRFGIVAKIKERWQIVSGKPYCSWSLLIRGGAQLKMLSNMIGLTGPKGVKLTKFVNEVNQQKVRKPYIANNRQGDIFFDKIESIKVAGKVCTYDLSVESNFSFIANNLIVHNSFALIHLAKMALMHRVRVVHISLEMSEERCAQRYFQAMLALAKRNEAVQVTRFVRDNLGRITDFDDARVIPSMSMDDPHIRKKLERSIDRWALRAFSNIVIKAFPTGMLTVPQLAAYLDSLEATQQFVPDLLVIDYPDLMKLDKNNYRLALDELFKDLRGLLVRRNIAGAAVSQSNRSGEKAKQVGVENVAEAYSKIAHADTILTYSQTEAEHKLGLARLHVAAGRNDTDRFTILISQNYAMGNFVVDSAMMTSNYWGLIGANTEGGETQE